MADHLLGSRTAASLIPQPEIVQLKYCGLEHLEPLVRCWTDVIGNAWGNEHAKVSEHLGGTFWTRLCPTGCVATLPHLTEISPVLSSLTLNPQTPNPRDF